MISLRDNCRHNM